MMKFQELSLFLSNLEATASRNTITEILAELLTKAEAEEVDKICYLTLGRIGPAYEPLEFNLAEKLMLQVLARAYQQEIEKVRELYKEKGDLGEVALRLAPPLKSKLSVLAVFDRLTEVAKESGSGSVERKIKKMADLLCLLDPTSAKFVARIPVGKLRLGFSELTIMDALSFLVSGGKGERGRIEKAYNVRADVGQLAKIIKEKGLGGLSRMKVAVGVPVMPALCQRLPSTEEIVKKMGQVAVEPKYDGTRLQIHLSRKRPWEQEESQLGFDFRPAGFVRTYTRNLENTTAMFPDLVKAALEEIVADEVILDGEAIGYDPQTGHFLPFQETIKRKRKYEIGQTSAKIPLRFFCFDIMAKNGQDLLALPFAQRRQILAETLSPKSKTFLLSPQIVTDDPEVIRTYHDQQIKKGLEGIVAKKRQSPYDPGRRGFTWVKLKQEKGKKGGGLADTLDCVVMGYYTGRGKRAGFGIGAFLVGIREKDQFLTISKIGTGLTDEQWQEMKERADRVKTGQKPHQYQVNKNLTPDVWCFPEVVVEIEADNITKSPIHTAGFALRFPRLVAFRDDRSPAQATDSGETKRLFRLQGK